MTLLLHVALLAAFLAQLSPSRVAERIKVDASASAEKAAPDQPVTLTVDISPRQKVRVFAPGAKNYSPVFLAISPSRDYKVGIPKYPIPKRQAVPGTSKKVLLYDDRFKLEQTIVISKNTKVGTVLTIRGMLNYQACDDERVYPRSAVPVSWTVTVQ